MFAHRRSDSRRTDASPPRARPAAQPRNHNRAWTSLSTRHEKGAPCPQCEEEASRGRAKSACPACEARAQSAPPEHAEDGATGGAGAGTAAARPTSENVWGLLITRSMCGCRAGIRDDIDWANEAGATYAACDVPANATATDVEACFDAAHPTAVTVATTSAGGTVTLPPPSADPCGRIRDKATFVHETFHARHTEAMARARGSTFYAAWRALAGDPDRLDKLRATFPAEVADFEAQWNDGHDWAQDEVNSYRWERRFLTDALRALNRIC